MTTKLARLIAWLEGLPETAWGAWGLAHSDIDDGGGYGDPYEDTRPAFVRQDEDEWEVYATYDGD